MPVADGQAASVAVDGECGDHEGVCSARQSGSAQIRKPAGRHFGDPSGAAAAQGQGFETAQHDAQGEDDIARVGCKVGAA